MGRGTSFVGRQEVEHQVDALLDHERIVTLTGTGGIGKTRLAGEVAALRAESGDTTAFIELAPAKPGSDLAITLARQMGHASGDAFLVGLDGASTLIVLDNCEHVRAEAAALAAGLIKHPNVSVLATSRAPLTAPGEYVVKLGPLPVPDVGDDADTSPALELFLDRAATTGAGWLQVPEQRAAAAEIVRRLDGVPLAIELAAARTRVLAPSDLLALLARQLDLLADTGADTTTDADAGNGSGGRRDVRSAVYASYEPISPHGQRAFRALSLVPQGVDLELAHALSGEADELATLDLLTELIDQSLLYTAPGAAGSIVYRMLEPVRAFGTEQLDLMGERGDVADRYVDAVCEFANHIVVATATSFSGELLDQIAQRYVHLLQAIEIALEIDDTPGRSYRLLLPLYSPTKAPRREQAQLAARVRDRWPDSPDRFRAAAYAIMAHVALWAGNDDPTPYAQEALDDPSATRIARIIAYRVLGFDAGRHGDREMARTHIESALDTAASRGGSFERELKMSWASLVDDPADVPEAIETAEAMSVAASESGETVTVVWAASVCVHQYLRRGDIAEARVAAERALAFAEQSTSPWTTASARRALAFVCTAEHDWISARSHFGAALESVVGIGDIEGVTLTARSAAICAQHCGEPEQARRLWTAVPTRHGASALPPLFTNTEHELVEQFGEPLPLPLADSIRAAREALSPPHGTEPTIPEADEAADVGVYRFNGFELDTARRELRRDGADIHIEPQVFDVLTRLVADAGTVVTKEQLMDDVWGSRFVSPSALTSRIKTARAATGDDGKAQQVIRTIHGRGFMFVAELD